MQLALFASIALLCSSALAAPPQRRGSDPALIDVGVLVENVANNLSVSALTGRDASVDLSNLRARGGSSGSLIGVGVDVSNVLNNATVKVLSP
ncbi:hypothetical protein K503DRAFT_766754 [Rhizopogon vinicolor AM-OR11-026]|uniref:Hydrophobin n=1 Tax=Rhizopogon vinicolor AM-OR11-026 TaxID=1314800 RepID=A0A1B7NCB9_9AGAM|nr:hypothetical protein K503DRAFT_766754 [Rhizopogon vinicolor AM-OR11-026]